LPQGLPRSNFVFAENDSKLWQLRRIFPSGSVPVRLMPPRRRAAIIGWDGMMTIDRNLSSIF
jgi:hypothetical protein